jgi:hypothetical protein
MSELLSALQLAGMVLGVWTVMSLAAAVPLLGCFRRQALANELVSREARRSDWLAAARPAAR